MLRASLLVLLSCACLPALAQNGRASLTGNSTACQDIADKTADATLTANDNDRSKAIIRNKYTPATPALPNASSPATTRGGGGDGDVNAPALPRPRGPKWHSFLPGMFR